MSLYASISVYELYSLFQSRAYTNFRLTYLGVHREAVNLLSYKILSNLIVFYKSQKYFQKFNVVSEIYFFYQRDLKYKFVFAYSINTEVKFSIVNLYV